MNKKLLICFIVGIILLGSSIQMALHSGSVSYGLYPPNILTATGTLQAIAINKNLLEVSTDRAVAYVPTNWVHLLDPHAPYTVPYYLNDHAYGQMVYATTTISCPGEVVVMGKEMELTLTARVGGVAFGERGESALLVDAWRCISN